ncbi:thioesterase family protein [Mailhella massiliensis]|uniref:Acyl-CoA thioesterase n=1 Tax=Mailhella massiliensis TaxID=1903261 RepID=A0A921AUQ5_9BACT|nr:thioesterase family protein [Mailhella massiliensis]HJD96250.1 acyl-CoA thioesterase [Mailhella massiliensis]
MEETFSEIWLPHYVSYGETDAMGVVYYAEYIHFFERARGALCREAGIGYGKIEESGFMLPVREVECRYRSPAHYDELLQIHAHITEWRRASVRFQYEIYNEDRTKLLCEGMTLHAVVNKEGRPVAVPAWIKDTLSRPKNDAQGEKA